MPTRSPPRADQASSVPTLLVRFSISAPAVLLALAVLLAAVPVKALDLDELTVVTVAGDGSWGVATAGSQGPAIAAAIRNCQAMAAAPTDCGAQSTTTRGGWVVAKLCGGHKIIVAAETREAAEREALAREMALKRLYACTRALTVGPGGAVAANDFAPVYQVDSRREGP